MKFDQAASFIKKLGATMATVQNRTGWFIARCPLAPWSHDDGVDKSPSFACKDEPGDAFTTCFSCGWHGSMSALVIRMQQLNTKHHCLDVKWGDAMQVIIDAEDGMELDLDYDDLETVMSKKKADLTVFPEWWASTFQPWDYAAWSIMYLKERKVLTGVCTQLELKIDTQQKRICFPIRDFKKRLVGLHGRCVYANVEPRYRMYQYAGQTNPQVWLGEHWVDTNLPILVVEGPFDVASCLRVYPNVVSPLWATPSLEKLRRMGDVMEWVTLYDRGGGGDSGRTQVDKALGSDYVVTHLKPPENRKDPGEMTVPELRDLLGGYLQLSA